MTDYCIAGNQCINYHLIMRHNYFQLLSCNIVVFQHAYTRLLWYYSYWFLACTKLLLLDLQLLHVLRASCNTAVFQSVLCHRVVSMQRCRCRLSCFARLISHYSCKCQRCRTFSKLPDKFNEQLDHILSSSILHADRGWSFHIGKGR